MELKEYTQFKPDEILRLYTKVAGLRTPRTYLHWNTAIKIALRPKHWTWHPR